LHALEDHFVASLAQQVHHDLSVELRIFDDQKSKRSLHMARRGRANLVGGNEVEKITSKTLMENSLMASEFTVQKKRLEDGSSSLPREQRTYGNACRSGAAARLQTGSVSTWLSV